MLDAPRSAQRRSLGAAAEDAHARLPTPRRASPEHILHPQMEQILGGHVAHPGDPPRVQLGHLLERLSGLWPGSPERCSSGLPGHRGY